MVQITGKFVLEKNENFKEYLIATGVPEERAVQVDQLRPTFEVIVDGDRIFLNSDTGVTNSTSALILGKEVDEPIPTITTLKSRAELEGDTLIVTSTAENGNTGKRIYKFYETEMIMTITNEKTHIPEAKRFYKRLELLS